MAVELPYAAEEHDSRVLCGDPVACGYEWIKRYAENLSDRGSSGDDDDEYYGGSVTAEELIETATNNIEQSSGWGDYISKGPLLDGVSVDPTFWDKLADFKQIEIPQDKRNNFFSCSC